MSPADKFTIGVLNYRTGSDKFIIREKGYYNVTDKGDVPIFLYTAEENLKKSRIRHFLKGKFPSGNIPDTMLVIDKSPGFKYFKTHCTYLGIPDTALVHIEDLPKPPRIPREAKTATTNEINYVVLEGFKSDARSNNVWWGKKANTFNGKDTYYYIDFYYSDAVLPGKRGVIGGKLGSDVDVIIRFLKSKNIFAKDTTHVWGINVKNKHLLKVGTWVNIYDLAKKEATKYSDEWGHNLYLMNLGDSLSRLSNVRRMASDALLSKIANKETIATFKAFIDLTAKVHEINTSDTQSLTKLFKIEPKNNEKQSFNLKEFEKLLEEKYMGIFTMMEYHSVPAAKLARIVNFIDEKS